MGPVHWQYNLASREKGKRLSTQSLTPSKLMAEPELIVSGPRKRKETSCVTDNVDPLLKKKARLAPKANAKSDPKTPCQRPSVEIQEVDNDANTIQHESPKNPSHIIKAADGSDDKELNKSPAPDLTDVDDKDEDNHKESAEDKLHESIP